jgi:hypothetical protein
MAKHPVGLDFSNLSLFVNNHIVSRLLAVATNRYMLQFGMNRCMLQYNHSVLTVLSLVLILTSMIETAFAVNATGSAKAAEE